MNQVIGSLVLAGASLFAQAVPARSVFDHVPEKSRPKRNPLANDANAPVAGEKLFQQHCAQCHGSAAEGGRMRRRWPIPKWGKPRRVKSSGS